MRLPISPSLSILALCAFAIGTTEFVIMGLLPEVSSDPESEALPEPPPPMSAAVVAGPRRRGRWVTAGLAGLGLAWWGVHALMGNIAGDTTPALRDPAVLAAPEAGRPATPASSPPLQAPATPELPPPPPMLEVLDTASVALRRCSTLAGGLLLVEFTTLEKRDTFGSVAVSGTTNPDLDRCVREATADMHFQPRHAETFSKEYIP